MTRRALVSTLALAAALGLALPAVAGKPLAPLLPMRPDAARAAKQKNKTFNARYRKRHMAFRVHKTAHQWVEIMGPPPTAKEVGLPVYPRARLLSWQPATKHSLARATLVTLDPADTVLAWYRTHLGKPWHCPKSLKVSNMCTLMPKVYGPDGDDEVSVGVIARKPHPVSPLMSQGEMLAIPKGWKSYIEISYQPRHAAKHARPDAAGRRNDDGGDRSPDRRRR